MFICSRKFREATETFGSDLTNQVGTGSSAHCLLGHASERTTDI